MLSSAYAAFGAFFLSASGWTQKHRWVFGNLASAASVSLIMRCWSHMSTVFLTAPGRCAPRTLGCPDTTSEMRSTNSTPRREKRR